MEERLLVLLVIEKASQELCVDIYVINPELIVTFSSFIPTFSFITESAFRLLFNVFFVFIHRRKEGNFNEGKMRNYFHSRNIVSF